MPEPLHGVKVRFASVFVLLGASWALPASAQPVIAPEASPCRVVIALAPDRVRVEIEAWVAAEPRCETALEIRVVTTSGGLYLTARDDAGRVRERIVPDARSAAVLVVSWMADDSLGATPPAESARGPRADTADAAPPPPALPAAPAGLVAIAARASRPVHRWMTLGGIASDDEVGVRGQVDLLGGPRWSLGVAGGWRSGERARGERMDGGGAGDALVVASVHHALGSIDVRAQVGLGAELADDRMGVSIAPELELGLVGAVHVGPAWQLVGGPVVDVRAADDGAAAGVSLFFGVRHGL